MADKDLTDSDVGLLDVIKKCPFCQNTLHNGLTYFVCDNKDLNPKHKLLCNCGWHSRGFDTLDELVGWFNTRAGRKFEIPKVTAKHNKSQVQADLEPEIESAKAAQEEVF